MNGRNYKKKWSSVSRTRVPRVPYKLRDNFEVGREQQRGPE